MMIFMIIPTSIVRSPRAKEPQSCILGPMAILAQGMAGDRGLGAEFSGAPMEEASR